MTNKGQKLDIAWKTLTVDKEFFIHRDYELILFVFFGKLFNLWIFIKLICDN